MRLEQERFSLVKNTDFKSEKKPLSSSSICQIALAGAMICVLSMVSIPLPFGVPITLQTMAVSLAGLALGQKKGAAAVCVYLALGAVGLPVFSGMTGGFGRLLGATGGFLWGFPAMAFLAGLGASRETRMGVALGLLGGIFVSYSLGLAQFMFVTGSDLQAALLACVIPFLPVDAVKAVAAGVLGMELRRRLQTQRQSNGKDDW